MWLAFATTIHKSQGSEYPAIVIPVSMNHYMMLRWNLIYTGVTRGKKLVVLVGQRRALGVAVRTAEGGQRWSKLGELLKANCFAGSNDSLTSLSQTPVAANTINLATG